jgi:hypothetical protein
VHFKIRIEPFFIEIIILTIFIRIMKANNLAVFCALALLISFPVEAQYSYSRWSNTNCGGEVYSVDIRNSGSIPGDQTDGACVTVAGVASYKYQTVTATTVAPNIGRSSAIAYYYIVNTCPSNASVSDVAGISVTYTNSDGKMGGTSVFTCDADGFTEKKPDGTSIKTTGNCTLNSNNFIVYGNGYSFYTNTVCQNSAFFLESSVMVMLFGILALSALFL